MGIRLSQCLDAATQKESTQGEKPGRTRVLPALGCLQVHTSAQQKQSERIDPCAAQRGRAENMPDKFISDTEQNYFSFCL